MFRLENTHKLITKEDPFHVHKLLGTICLVHFAFRFWWLVSTGDMKIHTLNDMYMISLHGVLSLSSFQFHLPKVRNVTKPMIYPEFRAHSVLFAMRSVVVCWLHYYHASPKWIMLVCYQTMLGADYITRLYRTIENGQNGNTMRNMPFESDISPEDQRQIISMHSNMQIGATLFMLNNTNTAFLPLFAIQFAALLMTMVRKSIISAKTWHLLYSMSLWTNYESLVWFPPGSMLLYTYLFNVHHRLYFPRRTNKYLAWTGNFLVYSMLSESALVADINERTYSTLEWVAFGQLKGVIVWYIVVKLSIVVFYVGNYYQFRTLFS